MLFFSLDCRTKEIAFYTMAFITAEIKAQFKPCGFYRNLSLCLIWSQKLKKDSFIGQLSTLRLVEVCCSGARFTKQYNEPEKTLFPSCIRRFICEWTEVSRHASRVWFVQCHHPLLQPPPLCNSHCHFLYCFPCILSPDRPKGMHCSRWGGKVKIAFCWQL